MPKVSKSVLKDLVKECLVEILSEGIAPSAPKKSRNVSRKRPISSHLPARGVVNESFEANIDNAVGGMTDDPVMASIFADTARTTLQEQAAADSGNRSMTDNNSDTANLDDVFGEEAAQNWEHLAFPDKQS